MSDAKRHPRHSAAPVNDPAPQARKPPLWWWHPITVYESELFKHPLAYRLWALLESWAKRAGKDVRTVRFSHPSAAQWLCYREGRKLITPSRRMIQRALELACNLGFASVPPADMRKSMGRSRGWFPVTLTEPGFAGIATSDAVQGAVQGAVQARSKLGPSRGVVNTESIADSSYLIPASNGRASPRDFVEAWNLHRGDLPEVKALSEVRRYNIEAALHECPDLKTWVRIFQRKARDPFFIERRYGLDTILRGDNRARYLDEVLADHASDTT